MPRARKSIPKFKSETEERAFWDTHDTADYLDWSRAEVLSFPNLKPSTATISLRLPAQLLAELKRLANKRDVPYQSLLKIYLAERVTAESAKVLPESSTRRAKVLSSPRRPALRARKSSRT